ncbi:unnamed protein product [Soboliphyme baturini]|uniref:Uncharacterized protein n=1 Tax=Soboliphyme baturini TaxID=241478 RepID=A0A183ITI8_9BILA|nr:unnamed protein product [Soboliphyme baturini]
MKYLLFLAVKWRYSKGISDRVGIGESHRAHRAASAIEPTGVCGGGGSHQWERRCGGDGDGRRSVTPMDGGHSRVGGNNGRRMTSQLGC